MFSFLNFLALHLFTLAKEDESLIVVNKDDFLLYSSAHCVCSIAIGIHFKGEFDLANMTSITYESQKLKERVDVETILLEITAKSNMQAFTIPLNDNGLFVSNFLQYNEQLGPQENLKALFDDEDMSCDIMFTNDWQGHFAAAETLQQGRVFLAGIYWPC